MNKEKRICFIQEAEQILKESGIPKEEWQGDITANPDTYDFEHDLRYQTICILADGGSGSEPQVWYDPAGSQAVSSIDPYTIGGLDDVDKKILSDEAEEILTSLGIPEEEWEGDTSINPDDYDVLMNTDFMKVFRMAHEAKRYTELENTNKDSLSTKERKALILGERLLEKRAARLRWLRKYGKAVAGVLAVTIIGGVTLTATGRMPGFAEIKEVFVDGRLSIEVINQEDEEEMIVNEEADLAYEEIEGKIGVRSLIFHYMPEGMGYLNSTIDEKARNAIIHYGGETVSLDVYMYGDQGKIKTVADEVNEPCFEVEVIKTGDTLTVWESDYEGDDRMSYTTGLVVGVDYYNICGVMQRDEFIKIIESIYY